jgi:hypothetical protein
MGMPRKQKAILAIIGLAVVGMLVIFGHESSNSAPRDECPSKGIDPEQRKEGRCENDGTENVVVDRDHPLRLETLEARLEGMRKGPVPGGGSPKRILVTFELKVTNRTGSPQHVGENQFVLLLGAEHGEDVEAEEGEPGSFLSSAKEIQPGATEAGTVTFLVAKGAPKAVAEKGNLDIGNFGSGGGDYEPEGLFEEPEVGVIRTYG